MEFDVCLLAGTSNTRQTNECNDTKDIHQNIEGAEVWTCSKGHTLITQIYHRCLNLLCNLLMDMRIHYAIWLFILIFPEETKSTSSLGAVLRPIVCSGMSDRKCKLMSVTDRDGG